MPLKASSDDRAIARGMLTVTLLVLLGSVARAGREVAIAYRYGVSTEVDAYLFVFNLVQWPLAIWFAILTVVVVPLAARIRENAPADLLIFRAELLSLSIAIGLIFTSLSLWLLPLLLQSKVVGLSPQLAQTALNIVTPMSFLIPFGILAGLFSVWTMTMGKHVNTLLEAVPSVCIFLAILTIPLKTTLPLVVGTVIGFVVHSLALFLLLHLSAAVEKPQFRMVSSHWGSFFRGFGIMLAGQVLMSITTLIDQFFAGQLGDGRIATLNYANRILALLMGVGALAVSRTALPLFSLNQEKSNTRMVQLAGRWAWRLFGVGLCVLAIAWLTAPLVVALFFERGAFTAANTFEVVDVLRLCVFQVPFYISAIVLTSYFASQGSYMTLLWSSILALTVKMLASYFFTGWWGLYGLPLSSIAMYAATFTMLTLTLGMRKKHRQHSENEIR